MPPAGTEWGRFDDLVDATALEFSEPFRVVMAHEPAGVATALVEVDRATAAGCWAFGFVSYEAAAGLDPRWTVNAVATSLPLVWFGLCRQARQLPPVPVPVGTARDYRIGGWRRGWTEHGYRTAVEQVRAAIAAGDSYQCNLTVRMHGQVTGDLEQLYADLAWSQQGAHSAYLDTGRHVIASASPELFFTWSGNHLLTRPMKGTAPRGRTTGEDADQLRRLLGSEKERAENVMIVDLLRNDLSQIAAIGSVDVPALFAAERYETVWQLTSDVTGITAPDTGLVDVFRALFPSGSVTGAPKRRTMELITELEPEPRGVYCGAVGVVAPPGEAFRARFNVAIRTVTIDRTSGAAVYGTGGGITWSSDPAAEHAELLTKSQILSEPYEDFALFETMAHLPGTGLRNLDRHLARLADSAAYFGFAFDPQRARSLLDSSVRADQPARVKLTLNRNGELAVQLAALRPTTPGPVRLVLDPEPVDQTQRWLFHKTTRRAVYTDRAARQPAADDVILVNGSGELTETTIANLAVELAGRWWTPPASAGCLPGVERGRLLELGQLTERRLTPADLVRATGLAVVSSLRGWRAAALADESLARVSARGHHVG